MNDRPIPTDILVRYKRLCNAYMCSPEHQFVESFTRYSRHQTSSVVTGACGPRSSGHIRVELRWIRYGHVPM